MPTLPSPLPDRTLRPGRRKRVSAAVMAWLAVWPALSGAQTWLNPGTGDWFDGANWAGGVPLAGDGVVISNGGTATLGAPPSITPQLGNLSIGVTGSGVGVGSVLSNGVDIRSGFLTIGGDFGVAGASDGLLRINGAGGSANGIFVASASSSGAASNLKGRLIVSGDFVNGPAGSFVVGESFLAGRGTVTNGSVTIGGNAGAAQFFVVGDVFNTDSNAIGSRSSGTVQIGGNLAVSVLANIGVTFDARVVDLSAPGGVRFSEATGAVTIGGTLSVSQPNVRLNIGSTAGGLVAGTLNVNMLDIAAANVVALDLGNAFLAGGQATGSFTAASGDLLVKDATRIGTASQSQASGTLSLGGRFINTNNAGLSVGTVGAGQEQAAQALGSVNAAGGVSGFGSYNVGSVLGIQAAGATAQGSLVGGVGPASTTGFIGVGTVISSEGGGAATASGTLGVGNALTVNNGSILVGEAFQAARGSVATGSLTIGGNAGTAQFFSVGEAFSSSNAEVGIRATGSAVINGNLAVSQSISVGNAFNDRVAEATAAGGFRFNQASGQVVINGVLSIAGPTTSLNVGSTTGGVTDGSLRVGQISMGANTLGFVGVGNAFGPGQAQGVLEVNGGLLRAGSLNVGVGNASGGTSAGTLRLNHADLVANDLFAGTAGSGVASAQLFFSDSQSTVSNLFVASQGLLSVERSRLTLGNALLGDGLLTHIEIDGLARGSEYGAIDALDAFLAGSIEFDLGDLVFSDSVAVFDILRSGAADGISGDFNGFSFINLPVGYAATAGIELDGGVEIYRVRLARSDLPEPAPLALLLAGAGLLARVRRRAACRGRSLAP